ncbi:MAG: molecular chaperone TorD family protein [Pirellulaceae bacterium]
MSPQQHESIANVYGLLGQLWLQEVDETLLQTLCETSLGESLGISNDNDSIDQLAVDYCALFVGPKNHLPPYQSVWQTGQLQSETSASVRAFDDALTGGAIIGQDAMADHLGWQLRFMSQLYQQLSCADDVATTEALAQMGNAFFGQHLMWPKQLLVRARAQAQTQFFRSMIGLTGDLLSSEQDFWIGASPA